MFNSIKEFFVGKPKVEEAPIEEAPTKPPVPVVAEIKPETVVISVSDSMNVSVGSQSDTITFPPADSGVWPFPTTPPIEAEVKKKRTPVTGKKPTPAITATKTKPRKKK